MREFALIGDSPTFKVYEEKGTGKKYSISQGNKVVSLRSLQTRKRKHFYTMAGALDWLKSYGGF
jgi:hypothetical protein